MSNEYFVIDSYLPLEVHLFMMDESNRILGLSTTEFIELPTLQTTQHRNPVQLAYLLATSLIGKATNAIQVIDQRPLEKKQVCFTTINKTVEFKLRKDYKWYSIPEFLSSELPYYKQLFGVDPLGSVHKPLKIEGSTSYKKGFKDAVKNLEAKKQEGSEYLLGYLQGRAFQYTYRCVTI